MCLIWHLVFTYKHTVHHSSKKHLITTDGYYYTILQLVRPRRYASERCPILGDTSIAEPLHQNLQNIAKWGAGRTWGHPSVLTVKLPYTVACSAHRRPQLTEFQRMGASRVCVPGWDSCIKPHPPKAQGSLQKRGRKDCKSQGWCMNVEKQRLSDNWKLAHVDLWGWWY